MRYMKDARKLAFRNAIRRIMAKEWVSGTHGSRWTDARDNYRVTGADDLNKKERGVPDSEFTELSLQARRDKMDYDRRHTVEAQEQRELERKVLEKFKRNNRVIDVKKLSYAENSMLYILLKPRMSPEFQKWSAFGTDPVKVHGHGGTIHHIDMTNKELDYWLRVYNTSIAAGLSESACRANAEGAIVNNWIKEKRFNPKDFTTWLRGAVLKRAQIDEIMQAAIARGVVREKEAVAIANEMVQEYPEELLGDFVQEYSTIYDDYDPAIDFNEGYDDNTQYEFEGIGKSYRSKRMSTRMNKRMNSGRKDLLSDFEYALDDPTGVIAQVEATEKSVKADDFPLGKRTIPEIFEFYIKKSISEVFPSLKNVGFDDDGEINFETSSFLTSLFQKNVSKPHYLLDELSGKIRKYLRPYLDSVPEYKEILSGFNFMAHAYEKSTLVRIEKRQASLDNIEYGLSIVNKALVSLKSQGAKSIRSRSGRKATGGALTYDQLIADLNQVFMDSMDYGGDAVVRDGDDYALSDEWMDNIRDYTDTELNDVVNKLLKDLSNLSSKYDGLLDNEAQVKFNNFRMWFGRLIDLLETMNDNYPSEHEPEDEELREIYDDASSEFESAMTIISGIVTEIARPEHFKATSTTRSAKRGVRRSGRKAVTYDDFIQALDEALTLLDKYADTPDGALVQDGDGYVLSDDFIESIYNRDYSEVDPRFPEVKRRILSIEQNEEYAPYINGSFKPLLKQLGQLSDDYEAQALAEEEGDSDTWTQKWFETISFIDDELHILTRQDSTRSVRSMRQRNRNGRKDISSGNLLSTLDMHFKKLFPQFRDGEAVILDSGEYCFSEEFWQYLFEDVMYYPYTEKGSAWGDFYDALNPVSPEMVKNARRLLDLLVQGSEDYNSEQGWTPDPDLENPYDGTSPFEEACETYLTAMESALMDIDVTTKSYRSMRSRSGRSLGRKGVDGLDGDPQAYVELSDDAQDATVASLDNNPDVTKRLQLLARRSARKALGRIRR